MKKKEKKYGLLKGMLLMILIAIVLSWLIPNGQFSATGYVTDGALARIGLTDLSWLVYYGFYFALDKIVMLLAIGGLYGVLSKTEAYDRIVTGIANKLHNKKIAVVAFSILLAVLTSMFTQTFVVLIFVPFIISILKKMNLDKLTILATTFGSMLVGILGATYGTEGLVYLNRYITAEDFNVNSSALIRAGVLVIGLVLFNFFTLSRISRQGKDKNEEKKAQEEIVEKQKGSILPIAIIGVLIIIISVLGYVNWNAFNINVFDKFHETLTDIHIGKDFYVFKSILGTNISALGTWDLFNISAIVFFFTIILGLCYRLHLQDFIKSFADGVKKVIKPCFVVVGAFTLMVVVYMSPYIGHIINKLLSLSDGFNLATMSLSALIMNIFHTDLGFSGYIVGAYLSAEYVDFLSPIYVIFSTLYGFVQFFIPTSIVLGIGLVSLDVKYTEWLKHIWKFLVGMLICLLVVFILMAVI